MLLLNLSLLYDYGGLDVPKSFLTDECFNRMASPISVLELVYAKLSYAGFVSELAKFLAPSKEPFPPNVHRSDLKGDCSSMHFTIVYTKGRCICRKIYL